MKKMITKDDVLNDKDWDNTEKYDSEIQQIIASSIEKVGGWEEEMYLDIKRQAVKGYIE